MSIEQTSIPTVVDPKWAIATTVMNEYFEALRGSWGDVDGRGMQTSWVLFRDRVDAVETNLYALRAILGLCPLGFGHWQEFCDEKCTCVCCGRVGCTISACHFHARGSGDTVMCKGPDLVPTTDCPVHGTHEDSGCTCCGVEGCTINVGHTHAGIDGCVMVGAPELSPTAQCPVHRIHDDRAQA